MLELFAILSVCCVACTGGSRQLILCLVRPFHMRTFIVFLILAATAGAQTTTPQPLPTVPVPEVDYYAAGPPRPTHEEFLSRVRYPYRASDQQQRRIERAARKVRIGWSEQQVLEVLGPPDYKAPWVHDIGRGRSKKTVLDEVWHWVHTMEKPQRYDEPGRILIISLDNRSKPRRVIHVDGVGIPNLKRRNAPEV
jgi:hypothetical protein